MVAGSESRHQRSARFDAAIPPVVRWSILGREVRELPFDQLSRTEVKESEDSDGGKVWRPAVHLRDGRVLLLSELWSHDERGVRVAVAAVAEICRLPAA